MKRHFWWYECWTQMPAWASFVLRVLVYVHTWRDCMRPLQTHFAVPDSVISCSVSCVRDNHKKETWTPNPLAQCVCELLQDIFIFPSSVFCCFPPLNPLTLVPAVCYSPISSTFSLCHSFIPLIQSITRSFTPVVIVWFSYSFLSNCSLSFSSTDCFP